MYYIPSRLTVAKALILVAERCVDTEHILEQWSHIAKYQVFLISLPKSNIRGELASYDFGATIMRSHVRCSPFSNEHDYMYSPLYAGFSKLEDAVLARVATGCSRRQTCSSQTSRQFSRLNSPTSNSEEDQASVWS